MRSDRRIGAFAVAAVIAATGLVHEAAAAGPSSPSTVIAPQVLRDQVQRPADAINRATEPVRAPTQDKNSAPGAVQEAPIDPGRPSQGSTPQAPK
jgi:hypothetical protein